MESVSETNKQKKEKKKLRRGQILFNSSVCVISYLWWKKLPQSTHSETWITQSQHMTVVQLHIKYVFIFWRFDILVYRNGHTNKAYFNFNGSIKQKKKKK